MGPNQASAITVRSWKPGAAPARINHSAITGTLKSGVPVWVDVTSLMDPFSIGQRLSRSLPGLHPTMISELINPRKSVVDYGSVRLVRWARFGAPVDKPTGEPPTLFIAGLHILRGSGWLATFRAPSWEAAGGSSSRRITANELIENVQSDWNHADQTEDDLATLWLLYLARSFQASSSSLARYLLNADLARWDKSLIAPTAQDLRGLAFRIDTLSIQVRELQRPGLPANQAWFSPKVNTGAAQACTRLAEGAVEFLDGLRRDVRAVLDQRLADASDQQSDRLQLVIGVLASIFLGPTLVATVFGAFPSWFAADSGVRAQAVATASMAVAAITGLGLWASRVPRDHRAVDGTRLGIASAVSLVLAVVAALVIAGLNDGSTRKASATERALKDIKSATRVSAEQAERQLVREQQRVARRLNRLRQRLAREGSGTERRGR